MRREGSCFAGHAQGMSVDKADARKSGEQALNMLNTLPRASAGLPSTATLVPTLACYVAHARHAHQEQTQQHHKSKPSSHDSMAQRPGHQIAERAAGQDEHHAKVQAAPSAGRRRFCAVQPRPHKATARQQDVQAGIQRHQQMAPARVAAAARRAAAGAPPGELTQEGRDLEAQGEAQLGVPGGNARQRDSQQQLRGEGGGGLGQGAV